MFTLVELINRLFTVFYAVILIRVVLSWTRTDRRHPFVRFIYGITDPLLAPFKNLIVRVGNVGVDLSPLLLLVIASLAQQLIVRLIVGG